MTTNTAIMEPNGTPTWADRDVVRRIHGPSKCADHFAAGTPELCSCKGRSLAAQSFAKDARIIAEARLEAFEAGRAFERASARRVPPMRSAVRVPVVTAPARKAGRPVVPDHERPVSITVRLPRHAYDLLEEMRAQRSAASGRRVPQVEVLMAWMRAYLEQA